MACTWFGEIRSCCCLPALTGPAWVLLKYVLLTIFLGSIFLVSLAPSNQLITELGPPSTYQIAGLHDSVSGGQPNLSFCRPELAKSLPWV